MNQEKSHYAGFARLPKLTDKEITSLEHKEFHKLRKSEHVQFMENLINTSHAVPPTEVNGAVLAYDGEQAVNGDQAYAMLIENEDGELCFKFIRFLGAQPADEVLYELNGKTKDQLLNERFSHVPPRSVLP